MGELLFTQPDLLSRFSGAVVLGSWQFFVRAAPSGTVRIVSGCSGRASTDVSAESAGSGVQVSSIISAKKQNRLPLDKLSEVLSINYSLHVM